jgi:hypothetical protein
MLMLMGTIPDFFRNLRNKKKNVSTAMDTDGLSSQWPMGMHDQ